MRGTPPVHYTSSDIPRTACDQCRKSKCKCERSAQGDDCKNCVMLGVREWAGSVHHRLILTRAISVHVPWSLAQARPSQRLYRRH